MTHGLSFVQKPAKSVMARYEAIQLLYLLTMERGGTVYIMTNKRNGTLYTGVTSDLINRVLEHKSKIHPDSFTARYDLNLLVYFETFSHIDEAIAREKQIKGGSRKTKLRLIEKQNPSWRDLYADLAEW